MSLFICTIAMLVSGTIAAISNKILFQLHTDGECQQSAFTKPYMMTLAMFIGESMCLALHHTLKYRRRKLIRQAQLLQWQQQRFPDAIDESFNSNSQFNNHQGNNQYDNHDNNSQLRSHLLATQRQHDDDHTDDDIYSSSFASASLAAPLMSPPLESSSATEQSAMTGANYNSPGAADASPKVNQSFNGSTSNPTSHIDDSNSVDDMTSEPGATKPSPFLYSILSLFDLSATAISGVGLEWITASTNQMLRGSAIVFVALFSICILHSRLVLKQWGAVLAVVVGLIMVGCSGMLRGEHDASVEPSGNHSNLPLDSSTSAPWDKQILGCVLVLIGTSINSLQNVLEEKLLKSRRYLPVEALELVGWEGVWGVAFSAALLLPIAQYLPGDDCHGVAENSRDSIEQLANRPLLSLLILLYVFSLALLNYYSMEISRLTSAVHRNLLSAARTVLVWLVSILLYYVFTQGAFGESIDWTSLLQLAGFGALIAGTVLYSSADNAADQLLTNGESHQKTHFTQLEQDDT